ncbi:MAG: energy-coupled thiamine transporter ThiT [Lachnospiraceae bacterium]|nr:energy-coupled thiamine transporter ThiT [Lachnospiraceae bacterium]
MVTYNAEDGAYSLTQAGIVVSVILVVVAVIIAAAGAVWLYKGGKKKGEQGESRITVKQLVFSAMALALAFPLSYIKVIHFPWGGSATLCSMFFVTIIGYWYGAGVGFSAAFAYSLLQFIQGGSSWMLSLPQVLLDYIFAFTALGISGFFKGKKHGMIIGYLLAVFARGVFHSLGGYLYWMDYMPEEFPQSLAMLYPVIYNYAYLVAEAAITIVILILPPVRSALAAIEKERKS